jgi:hypothetical protein
MHPSNNLLLPILRKHGDRLLKAQIEAMVKELSWEEQELFLRQQLEASVEAIREKLETSYPDYPFLTEWEPEILKKSLKAWVFALSGEQNYLLGIDDFSLTVMIFELGKATLLIGYSPNCQKELKMEGHKATTINNYRLSIKKPKETFEQPNINQRVTNNYLADYLDYLEGKTSSPPKSVNTSLTIAISSLSDTQFEKSRRP